MVVKMLFSKSKIRCLFFTKSNFICKINFGNAKIRKRR